MALTVLDVAELVVAELVIALDMDPDQLDAAVAELRQGGWLGVQLDGSAVMVDGARIWLSFDAPEQPKPDEVAAIAERFLTATNAALDLTHRNRDEIVRWVTEHQEMVLRAVRAGIRVGLYSMAAGCAAAAWQVAEQLPDPTWRRELATLGEEAAIKAREPLTLINLLNLSAEVFEEAGDRSAAEAQRVRVVRLAYELGDHDGIVAALSTLIALYNRWDRRGPAVDALLELADAQREAGNAIGRAEALAQLGSIMLSAGRPLNADSYLETAEDLLSQVSPESPRPTMRAYVLEQRGRALWQLGHTIRARRCFAQALEALGNHDPAAADRIRGLLKTHIDAPTLPDEKP